MSAQTETIPAARGRNLGIDALWLFAMLLICAVHIYNRGGVSAKLSGSAAELNYPVRVLCMTAANLYALISGYVMTDGRFRPGRLLELWLQVVVIGTVGCLIWKTQAPQAVTRDHWRAALLPVTQYEYWYFTAFAGVFVLSPLLNRGLRTLQPRQLRALMGAVFCLFSVGWLLGKMWYGDSFRLGSGYSMLWLLLLYVFGGCLKRSGAFRRTPALLLWICAALCITLLCSLNKLLGDRSLPTEIRDWRKLLLNYCNPLILALSLCIFSLFSRLRVGGIGAAVVRFFAPVSFSVYLIHVHPAAWDWLEDRCVGFAELPAALVAPVVLLAALELFLVCSLLGWALRLAFRALRIGKLCAVAERTLQKLWK